MPLRNRVDPGGDLIAVPDRGTMLGNRGVLHDDDRGIVRRYQHRRWLVCELSFQGRRRQIMRPHRYTELFFLDEAVALAAGHRPCARCRPDSYRAFLAAAGHTGADALDRALHRERTGPPGAPRSLDGLPAGAFVRYEDAFWLVLDDRLLRWSPGGYGPARRRPPGPVTVLTPATTRTALAAGYRPRLHPTAAQPPGGGRP